MPRPMLGDLELQQVQLVGVDQDRVLAEHEVDYEFHLYSGAGHGYANEGSSSYQDEPTRASWAVAYDFMERKLRG